MEGKGAPGSESFQKRDERGPLASLPNHPLRYFLAHESYYKLHPETKAFALKVLEMFRDDAELGQGR